MWYYPASFVADPIVSDIAPRPAGTVALAELTPGTTAVLRHVADTQSRNVLRSLGLVNGASLRLCRVGDPCIVQVRSTRIGLSKVVAQSVYVTTSDGAQP
jgi:Fe2+ transport system protein FeoA